MVRALSAVVVWLNRSPHPRGDGPKLLPAVEVILVFSPPAWGWSAMKTNITNKQLVLPTRVGMVRLGFTLRDNTLRSPHPRGDGPRSFLPIGVTSRFSPPAWGWSVVLRLGQWRGPVLPTRVGMVRASCRGRGGWCRSPHPRGDGPAKQTLPAPRRVFSPPAWGWSGICPNLWT